MWSRDRGAPSLRFRPFPLRNYLKTGSHPELDSGSLRKTAMLAAERFRIRQASLPVRNDVLGSFEIVPTCSQVNSGDTVILSGGNLCRIVRLTAPLDTRPERPWPSGMVAIWDGLASGSGRWERGNPDCHDRVLLECYFFRRSPCGGRRSSPAGDVLRPDDRRDRRTDSRGDVRRLISQSQIDCQRRDIVLARPPPSRRLLGSGHSEFCQSRMASLEATCRRDIEFALAPTGGP